MLVHRCGGFKGGANHDETGHLAARVLAAYDEIRREPLRVLKILPDGLEEAACNVQTVAQLLGTTTTMRARRFT